jgi:hypothetical protein
VGHLGSPKIARPILVEGVRMKLVYLILYTDTINEFACEAEWWIRLITVDSPEQLEGRTPQG